MPVNIHHDRRAGRFHADLDGGEAYLDYDRLDETTLDLRSTFVPPPARGRGVASDLVKEALAYARQNDYRVVPSCPYVRSFIEGHPEYGDLVAASAAEPAGGRQG